MKKLKNLMYCNILQNFLSIVLRIHLIIIMGVDICQFLHIPLTKIHILRKDQTKKLIWTGNIPSNDYAPLGISPPPKHFADIDCFSVSPYKNSKFNSQKHLVTSILRTFSRWTNSKLWTHSGWYRHFAWPTPALSFSGTPQWCNSSSLSPVDWFPSSQSQSPPHPSHRWTSSENVRFLVLNLIFCWFPSSKDPRLRPEYNRNNHTTPALFPLNLTRRGQPGRFFWLWTQKYTFKDKQWKKILSGRLRRSMRKFKGSSGLWITNNCMRSSNML